MRWALFACALVACGGGQTSETTTPKPTGEDTRAVPLGEWCGSLTQLMCVRAGSCIGSLEIATTCKETAQPSCLSGRAEDAPSGRNASELDACEKTYERAPCDGYMDAIAAHAECQARTP